jgi:hypothetical protein
MSLEEVDDNEFWKDLSCPSETSIDDATFEGEDGVSEEQLLNHSDVSNCGRQDVAENIDCNSQELAVSTDPKSKACDDHAKDRMESPLCVLPQQCVHLSESNSMNCSTLSKNHLANTGSTDNISSENQTISSQNDTTKYSTCSKAAELQSMECTESGVAQANLKMEPVSEPIVTINETDNPNKGSVVTELKSGDLQSDGSITCDPERNLTTKPSDCESEEQNDTSSSNKQCVNSTTIMKVSSSQPCDNPVHKHDATCTESSQETNDLTYRLGNNSKSLREKRSHFIR